MDDQAPTTPEEWRTFVLQFIGSLTICDHMGDVWDDINHVFRVLGITIPDADAEEFEELGDLGTWLGRRGVTTLHGTTLLPDDDDDE